MEETLNETETSAPTAGDAANDTPAMNAANGDLGAAVLRKVCAPPVPVTGATGQTGQVPCYRDDSETIHGMLVDNRSRALLYVDASNLAAVEHDYGAAIYEQVLAIWTNLILDMRGVEPGATTSSP